MERGLPWWPVKGGSALPMQGARVQPLVRELDPTCTTESFHAATKDSVCHYDWVQPNKHINIFKKGNAYNKIQHLFFWQPGLVNQGHEDRSLTQNLETRGRHIQCHL